MIKEAKELIENIKSFTKAANGPSGDAEHDAACEMRDSAKAFLRKIAIGGCDSTEAASLGRLIEDAGAVYLEDDDEDLEDAEED